MPQSPKSRRKPTAPRQRFGRWPVVSAIAVMAVMSAAALAAVPAMPATPSAAVVAAPELAPPPVPTVGVPYLAGLSNGTVAEITIRSARYTAPTVLTLDVGWAAWEGASMADPIQLEVLDGSGARARLHPLTRGALPYKSVQPGSPVRGLVAYDVSAGPAVLVVQPVGAKEATRITLPR